MHGHGVVNVDVYRQFYGDALPLIGTSASVSVMRGLITSQQATSKQTDVWLTSLAFVKNPTRDMMTELKVCKLGICLSACHLVVAYSKQNCSL